MIQRPDSDSLPEITPAPAAATPKPADRWWLLPALLVAAFGLLIWQVKTHSPVTSLDIRVRDRLQHWARSSSMDWAYRPGRGAADLGNESITLPFLLVVTALAARVARSWRPVLVSAGAFATLGTVILLKIWISRPGPSAAVLGNADLGYFPSGHTADAVLCYGTSALLLLTFVIPDTDTNTATVAPSRARLTRRLRQATIAAAVVLVLGIICGLLWSNFHWLSDTVGSLCWCGAALAALRRVARR